MKLIKKIKKATTTLLAYLAILCFVSGCNFISVNNAKKIFFEQDSKDGQATSPIVSSFLSALTGGYCFNKSDDSTLCWGNSLSDHPENIAPMLKTQKIHLDGKIIRDVYASQYTTCVITTEGLAYCWGEGFNGQLGNGAGQASSIPVMIDMSGVLSGKTIKSVALGDDVTCVIASNDLVYCWGEGSNQLLGNGSDSSQDSPVAVSTTGVLNGKKIKTLHVKFGTACVIADDDKVYCWGGGGDGQLGNGASVNSNAPVAVSTSLKFKSLKNMYHTICGIAEDDLAYCWGYGQEGQLGNGASVSSNVPVAVDMSGVLSGKTIKKLDGSGYNICVIASDDLPYCFGYGQGGELGNNALNDSNIPVAVVTSGVLSGKKIIDLSVAESSACVMDSNEDVYCWGNGSYFGEVGDGLSAVTPAPVKLVF